MFPFGPEYGAALPFLERSDPAAYFRTTPQQGQKFVVDLVDGRRNSVSSMITFP